MSTLVAVLRADDGAVQFANAALENTLGLSRRTLEGADFSTFFTDPSLLQTALAGARGRDFAALRYEASDRTLRCRYGAPMKSITTSTPRPCVACATTA